jgi:phage terminase large subunit-like protein
MLGWTLHPWQRAFADVALEVDDDGRLVYQTCIIIKPRRAGGTVLALSALVHRAHAFEELGPQRLLSTMQSGSDSTAMFRQTWLPRLEASEFADTYNEYLLASHERIEWENGSIHNIRAPKVGAGVGGDLDFWLDDEAWHWESTDFEEAVWPASLTRTDAQHWVVSMAGDDTSKNLIAKRDLGRSLVEMGVNEGVCYVEYSADPETDDLESEEVWKRVHPALGRSFPISKLRAQRQKATSLEAFAKEYLNVWPTGHAASLFDAEQWASRADRRSTISGTVFAAIDARPDRSSACIVVGGKRADERVHVEVVKMDSGLGWVVDHLRAMKAKQPIAKVALDGKNAAASLIHELEKAGFEVEVFGTTEAVRAAGAFFDAVAEDRMRWLGADAQPPLHDAVMGAAKRQLQGAFAWAAVPGTDISPLVASSMVLWTALTHVEPEVVEYGWRPWDRKRSGR